MFFLQKPVLGDALSDVLNQLDDSQKKAAAAKFDTQKQQLSIEATEVKQNKTISSVQQSDKLNAIFRASAAITNATSVLRGQPVAPEQLQEVNEVIRWFSRPIWVVCGGGAWFPSAPLAINTDPGAPADFAPVVQPHMEMLKSVSRSAGLMTKYQTSPWKTLGPLATAIAIRDHFVITNKHVLTEGNIAYQNVGDGTWSLQDGVTVKVEFPYEYPRCNGLTTTKEVAVRSVKYVDPTMDFAVLETEPGLPNYVTFSNTVDADPGDRVVVVGYPDRPPDGRTPLSPLQVDQAFSAPNGRTPFPAERMAAGMVFREQTVPDGYFAHDASTWGGNSGSVVVDLATGSVIGLHARGLESKTAGVGYNEAVLGSRIAVALAPLDLH